MDKNSKARKLEPSDAPPAVYYVVQRDPQGRKSVCGAFERRDRAESFADQCWADSAEGYEVYVARGSAVFRGPPC